MVTMGLVVSLSDRSAQNRALVGGKGASLALMKSNGLPIPDGFCVTTEAFRSPGAELCNKHLAFNEHVISAYQQLGSPQAAVRSSATWEDSEGASFAGQQRTTLNVLGEEALLRAIEECVQSLSASQAYRARMGLEEATPEMAVVVQRMVDAEVAGVLFTRDPLQPQRNCLRIEASWGLGETVVAGRVTPDRYLIDRQSKQILERHAGIKSLQIRAGGEEVVSAEKQMSLCLDDQQLLRLVELSEKVERLFDSPRDIEWAYSQGQFWLLQARPIAPSRSLEREEVRLAVMQEVAGLSKNKETVWSRIRLIENLARPTPMTWALVSQKLLSGSGGTGSMFRDLGYHPDPLMADRSPYDLIAGRPFLNLQLEPYLQSAKPDFYYPLSLYRQHPHLALDPKPVATFRQWLRLPTLVAQARRLDSLSKTFADKLLSEMIPAWSKEIERAKIEELSLLDLPGLYQRFNHWVERTLVAFARESLKPTLLAEFTQQALQRRLNKSFGSERSKELLGLLSLGAQVDPASDMVRGWRDLAQGKLGREGFLEQFGHRGHDEMELSSPRWEEDSSRLDQLSSQINLRSKPVSIDPERIAEEAKWDRLTRTTFKEQVELFQRYLGLRETGKHYLLQGYREIRRTLLEIDRRLQLNDGIFFLVPSELPDLIAGCDFNEQIAQRRRRRTIELTLEMPSVLLASDLEAIGRVSSPLSSSRQFQGTILSPGVARGTAFILSEPTGEIPDNNFILVCPSTDPSWVPYFAAASGLVMEVGGTLSHGAIVAREFGLPAVAGLPGILQQLQTGQLVQVDGDKGIVSILEDAAD